MKKIQCAMLGLLGCFVLIGVVAQEDEGEIVEQEVLTNDPTLQPMVRVIAHPEKFQNEVITVIGYYMRGTHVNHLYLDMESCLHFDSVNSIYLRGKLNDEDYIPCRRETVKGKLIYSSENRNWRNDSDLILEDVTFTDYDEH